MIYCFNLDLFAIVGQAVWRKVQDVGLADQYVSNPEVRVFIWHLLSMAHVPLDAHDEGLQVQFLYQHILNKVASFFEGYRR